MLPGTPERATHDYERNGTTSLYAALNITTGEVIASLHQRHRAIEFLKFLKTIDANVPAGLDVHLVLDNASSHKTPQIKRWLLQHPRFHLHFTPSQQLLDQSRRTLVLRTHDQAAAPRRAPQRPHLNADIRHWIETWNDAPKPLRVGRDRRPDP